MHPDLFALHARLEQRHWWFQGRAEIVAAVVGQLAEQQSVNVVDVGCGTGGMVRRLADSYRVSGYDTSQHAITLAQQISAPGTSLQHVNGVAALRPAIGAAQIVLLMDVLEHVPDDFLLLSEIVAAMPPGAHLVVTVPADPTLWSAHDVAFAHYRRYTAERLRAVWGGLAIDLRLLAPLNHRLAPAIRALRSTRQSGDQSDLSLPSSPVNAILRFIFAGERHRIVHALKSGTRSLPGHGVSWLAVLRRKGGDSPIRTRPADISPDMHDPEARNGSP